MTPSYWDQLYIITCAIFFHKCIKLCFPREVGGWVVSSKTWFKWLVAAIKKYIGSSFLLWAFAHKRQEKILLLFFSNWASEKSTLLSFYLWTEKPKCVGKHHTTTSTCWTAFNVFEMLHFSRHIGGCQGVLQAFLGRYMILTLQQFIRLGFIIYWTLEYWTLKAPIKYNWVHESMV